MLNGHGLIPTMSSSNLPDTAWAEMPPGWQSDVQQQLLSGENVRACLEVDLDERLTFARGLLIVTDRRLLACQPEVPANGGSIRSCLAVLGPGVRFAVAAP